MISTAYKVSSFEVILVRIFPAFSRTQTDYGEIQSISYVSVFSPNAGKCGKYAPLNNSKYGHSLRSGHGVDMSI